MNGLAQSNYALRLIEQIAGTGEAIPLHAHSSYIQLVEAGGSASPDLIVSRKRSLQSTLGSGALQTVDIEHLTEEGAAAFESSEVREPLGKVVTAIVANRPYEHRGSRIDSQRTSLTLSFAADSMRPKVSFQATVPFDDTMEAETGAAWATWGVDLDYGIDAGGQNGHLIVSPYHDMVQSILGELRDLRNSTQPPA